MSNILANRILRTELIEWKKLVPFQPDNLKKTEPHKLQKLVNSLCENGFSMNFYVWDKDKSIYIIDGHSRHEVLQLIESGAIYPKDKDGKEYQVTIPDKFPCSFLALRNKTEAKKAVLIYNSKYKPFIRKDSIIFLTWGFLAKALGNINKGSLEEIGIPKDWDLWPIPELRHYILKDKLLDIKATGIKAALLERVFYIGFRKSI